MKLFINPTDHRLRAGWRLLIHSLLVVLITLIMGSGLLLLNTLIKGANIAFLQEGSIAANSSLTLYSEFAFACGVTFATFIARRWLDRRSFLSLGFYFKWKAILEILIGILIAGTMMGFIYILEWGLGWIDFQGYGWQFLDSRKLFTDCGLVFILFILVGWTEELLSRGYHLQTLSEGLNRTWGVILSALIFALLHQDNPAFSISAFIGLFISGLFFCYAYYQRMNLWLPIGIHIGWNFFEGTVFGFQVSGLTDLPRLIYQSTKGINIVTGGAFGPEAGLILLPALLLGVLLIRLWAKSEFVNNPSPQADTHLG